MLHKVSDAELDILETGDSLDKKSHLRSLRTSTKNIMLTTQFAAYTLLSFCGVYGAATSNGGFLDKVSGGINPFTLYSDIKSSPGDVESIKKYRANSEYIIGYGYTGLAKEINQKTIERHQAKGDKVINTGLGLLGKGEQAIDSFKDIPLQTLLAILVVLYGYYWLIFTLPQVIIGKEELTEDEKKQLALNYISQIGLKNIISHEETLQIVRDEVSKVIKEPSIIEGLMKNIMIYKQ